MGDRFSKEWKTDQKFDHFFGKYYQRMAINIAMVSFDNQYIAKGAKLQNQKLDGHISFNANRV